MRLAVFCEAAADFRIASELFDRVLRVEGDAWVSDVLDADAESIRNWVSDGDGHSFFVVSGLADHARRLRVRVPHGHFNGVPGVADAVMGRTAFAVVRALIQQGTAIDGVLIIRDMDNQPARATGLAQARAEARSWASFEIVLGCAHAKRECWVLCGFDPADDERDQFSAIRQELGFAPNEHAHQLDATDEHAKRSAKRVVRVLTGDVYEREAQCWQITSLDTLHERDEATGLREFLSELKRLVPIVIGRSLPR